MPAVTRSMKRVSSAVAQPIVSSSWQIYDAKIFDSIKGLLHANELAEGKTAKMIAAIQLYDLLNKNLSKLLRYNPQRWVKFGASVYNKTTEFEIQRMTNFYADISVELVNKHCKTYIQVRKFLTSYLKNVRKTQPSLLDMSEKHIADAFKNIDEVEQGKNKVVKAFKRSRRNVPVVDYSGMDMTDEDGGSVYLCETKWKDRVPTHRWVKYPASQANELGDEDWCEEY